MSISRWRACVTALALLVQPAVALAQGAVRKPVVAVTHMKDLANTGQGPALETMIQTAITENGKFRVIERDFGELDSEQALARSGKVTSNNPGRVGGYEGVDFIVYGTITSASSGRQSDAGATIGHAFAQSALGLRFGGDCHRTVSSLAVDIKIVDHNTGELKFAKQIIQHTATRTSCSGDNSLDVTSLMRDAANQTATGLATTIYPIKVAGIQSDGTIVLNYGEGALTPDMVLAVYGQGAGPGIVDPDTGAKLTGDDTVLGLIRVTEVNTRFSKAVPASAMASAPPIGSIVREAPASMIAASAKDSHKGAEELT